MRKIALFPGSFDPITKGHQAIVTRALSLFDEIIIAIGNNSNKAGFFSIEDRLSWIQQVFAHETKVKIHVYKGLTVDFCKKVNANYILRGLRTSADFEFERTIAQMNKAMANDIETVFILSSPELSAINSTIVRDILRHGGDVSPFIPNGIKLNNKS